MKQYENQYGTVYAVRGCKGAPQIMCRAKGSCDWLISGTLAVKAAAAETADKMQAVLDQHAAANGWRPLDEPASAEPPLPMPGDVYRSAKSGQFYKIDKFAAGKASCYRTMRKPPDSNVWEPANGSLYPDLTDAQGEFESWIRTEQLEPTAPAAQPSKELLAELAPTALTNLPAFDYSGLDDQTLTDLHLAEREFAAGRRLAEIGLRRMADGVAIAHDALCGACDKLSQAHNNQHSEKTFGRWCESVGLNRKAAERLLQVSKLFDNSTPREQKVLEELGPSLLYAAAKPSAPAELVQAVKDGDITTHKQYQDLLARYTAEHAAREKAEREAALDRKEQEDANAAALRYKNECDRRAQDQQRLEGLVSTAQRERDEAKRRAAEAEKQRDGARDALQAAKLRGDKLKAENDALKAHPIEAQVVDEEEIDRRAKKRADELTAPRREELEALRSRHPADLEEAEQAIRDAYDSAIYTSRTIENAWHSLRPLLSCMDSERRVMAVRQLEKILTKTQEELRKCL